MNYPTGHAVYSVLELCYHLDQAPVFVLERAKEMQAALRRIFPKAKIEPASFSDWVNQPIRPQLISKT